MTSKENNKVLWSPVNSNGSSGGGTSPKGDYRFINVNITSSSPPLLDDTSDEYDTISNGGDMIARRRGATRQTPQSIMANSHNRPSGQRKHSAITFKTPMVTSIKRPNSTIGIPSSGGGVTSSEAKLPVYNTVQTKPSSDPEDYHDFTHVGEAGNAGEARLNPMTVIAAAAGQRTPITTIESPESEIISIDLNTFERDKTGSLCLPDGSLSSQLRKGSSNPQVTTAADQGEDEKNPKLVSPGQHSLPTRSSIILNGNILHSITPITNTRLYVPKQELSVKQAESEMESMNLNADMDKLNVPTARSSIISNEEDENLQRAFADTHRKDTIISFGPNLQIAYRTPSSSGMPWCRWTKCEKFLLLVLLVFCIITVGYFYLPPYLYKGTMIIVVIVVWRNNYICIFLSQIYRPKRAPRWSASKQVTQFSQIYKIFQN